LIAVAIIHLQDQGGLLGGESPTWLKYGYYLIEIGSLVSALAVIRGKVIGWFLGLAFTIGPFVGYVLSRSVGVPGDPGDAGNWGYLLGTVSLVVEGSFVILAALCLTRLSRATHEASTTVRPRANSSRQRESQLV
jgi:MFS family permease